VAGHRGTRARGPERDLLRAIVGVAILVALAVSTSGGGSPMSGRSQVPSSGANAREASPPPPGSSAVASPLVGPTVVTAFPPRAPATPYAPGGRPMGITDLGDAPNGTVSYSAPSFEGTATLGSISVCAASSPCGSTSLSFQLNLNFGFVDRGKWYDYWVQDVAIVDTSDARVTEVADNIWNFSRTGATMYASSVAGAGSVFSYSSSLAYYGFAVATSAALASFTLTVNASVTPSGLPSVTFLYDLGTGPVAYDNVTFPFATHLVASYDFVVNGTTPNPYGLAYDAEWVLGGPGGGSSTIDIASDLELALAEWNGHNYESVGDAVDYGSDTGETITQASVSEAAAGGSGTLAAQIVPGTETYGTLWTLATVARVTVQGPEVCNATLEPGAGSVPYLAGNATLLLQPGTLAFAVACNGISQSLGAETLVAGTTTALSLVGWTTLIFASSGLPRGDAWGASFGAGSIAAASANLTAFLPPGSYAYRIEAGPPGYLPVPSAGAVTVPTSGATVPVLWGSVTVTASAPSVDVGGAVTFSVAYPSNGSAHAFLWSGLPEGCPLLLNNSSVACVPSAAGADSVVATVIDASGDAATSPPFPFVVATDPSLTPLTADPLSIDANQTVTFSTSESGGVAVLGYFWSGLPTGCSSANATSVTCRPSVPGPVAVSVEVLDRNLGVNVTPVLSYTVNSDPSVRGFSVTPATGAPGRSFLLAAEVEGGVGPYSYRYVGLPSNCSSEDLPTISCTPASLGTYAVEVEVVDANGVAANRTVSFTVRSPTVGSPAVDPFVVAAIAGAALAAGVVVGVRRLSRRGSGGPP
jgi:Thermopsin